jgi:protein-disulfide isomerase
MSKFSGRDLLTPVPIIIAGAMVSGSIVWTSLQRPAESVAALAPGMMPGQQMQQPQPPAPQADIAKVSLDGNAFIGDAAAPVTMAYWFDYQCPYCKQEEETVFPQLIKDYVDQGKLKIVFKDFAFLGPDSQTASYAARAVWETAPDKFREWHKAMFDKQDDENGGWGNKDDILALTKSIDGIDAAKVEELMNNRAADYNKAMEADSNEGYTMGVGGTPSFLIGKDMIVGAQPYERLKAAIDAEIAAKSG